MQPEIAIQLDPNDSPDPKWQYHYLAGSTVTGKVHVICNGDLDCRAVRCVGGWHSEGRGDRDEGMVMGNTLHEGPISGNAEFPFSLTIPINGPISYSGHYINIVWQVKAVIDLAWKRDPSAEATFVVLPAPYIAED